MIFVTGGAGFIGLNLVLDCFAKNGEPIVSSKDKAGLPLAQAEAWV